MTLTQLVFDEIKEPLAGTLTWMIIILRTSITLLTFISNLEFLPAFCPTEEPFHTIILSMETYITLFSNLFPATFLGDHSILIGFWMLFITLDWFIEIVNDIILLDK